MKAVELEVHDPIGMAKKYGISVGRLPGWDNDLKSPELIRQLNS
ncbi:hypothetical protein [Pedobacter sp. GR22-6]